MAYKTGIQRVRPYEQEFICTVWVYNVYILRYKGGGYEYAAFSAIDKCSPRRGRTLEEVINIVRRLQMAQQLGRQR